MNKFLVSLCAVLVLAGMINSAVIEPAVCSAHEDAVSQQQENGQCCSVCHPAHHQAILPANLNSNFTANNSIDFVKFPQLSLSDSPARDIFHPPLAF